MKNELEKHIEEDWEILHRQSDLTGEELQHKLEDNDWRNSFINLVDCKQAVIEKESEQRIDVDALWMKFTQRNRKKRKKRLYSLLLCSGGLVASICLLFVLSHLFFLRIDNDDVIFAAIPQTDEVTLQVAGNSVMTLNEAEVLGHVEKTTQGWQSAQSEKRNLQYEDSKEMEWVKISVPRGKDFSLVLEDGTKVWLNAESSFEYPTCFNGSERIVKLSGEAYFDVVSDIHHPFIIETSNVRTRVLGTQFNLRRYSDDVLDVTLLEGKVEVLTRLSAQPISIHPGENLHYLSDGTYKLKTVDVDTYISWKKGVFYFDDASLSDVIFELGRWYNVNFNVENKKLLDYRLHFYCNRNDKIENALSLLENLGHFNISYDDGVVVIR